MIRSTRNGKPIPTFEIQPAGGARLRRAVEHLGDKLERLAKPFAKALKLKCLDKDGNLIPGTPCAKRRDALNRI